MSKQKQKTVWPPEEGGFEFINSDAFGTLLVRIVQGFYEQYPKMDFTDAVAQVFEWFAGRLAIDPEFIETRFSTAGAFRAYVRQAVWNAGLLAARQRGRHQTIVSLPFDTPIRADQVSAEELATLAEAVEKLTHPHKDILERIFFDEEAEAQIVAESMGLDLEEYYRIFEEAIDMLGKK